MDDVVLVVTFREGVNLPYEVGAALTDGASALLGPKLLQWIGTEQMTVQWLPRYTAVSPQRIEELVKRARDRDPDARDPGYLRTYELRVRGAKDLVGFIARLRNLKAHVRSVLHPSLQTLRPTELNPAGDAASNKLHYQRASKRTAATGPAGALEPYDWGVDAEYAWGVAGGHGEGTTVADVEQGWWFEHQDFPAAKLGLCQSVAAFVNGKPGDEAAAKTHGSCVVGVLAGTNATGTGVTGCAHGVDAVLVAGEFFRDGTGAVVKYAEPHNAALAALDKLDAAHPAGGGVLLLETSENWGWYHAVMDGVGVPIELRVEVHKVIAHATDLGHCVVEAAGNGGVDLDTLDYTLATSRPSALAAPADKPVDLSDPAKNDSGAILVGAADPPISRNLSAWEYMTGVQGRHRRWSRSCHGKRIDCYAWGDYVPSSSTPAADYVRFSGTSSAAAIVAGVVCILQGVRKAHGLTPLLPGEVRDLLRDASLATPVYDTTATTKIGHMPDLFKLLTKSAVFAPLGLRPDLYARDSIGDDGSPHTEPVGVSPDIIVRHAAEPTPQARWGEGSGVEDRDDVGQAITAGIDQFVYVRVRNRGRAYARNARARVYRSDVATLLSPGAWIPVGAGEAVFPDVPDDDTLVVSSGLLWPADPALAASGCCLSAVLSADGDPAPDLATLAFAEFAAFKAFLQANNNVVSRNVTTVEASIDLDDIEPIELSIPGAFDADREFHVSVLVTPPGVADVDLELPATLSEALGRPAAAAVAGGAAGTVRVAVDALPLVPGSEERLLGKGTLPRFDPRGRGAAPRKTLVHVAPSAATRAAGAAASVVEVAVVQRHEGDEVGRAVFRFRPTRAAVVG